MKKNIFGVLLCTAVFIISSSLTSFAGTWQSTENDWKYQNDDGSYITNAWLQDNGANYYFDANGFMLKNTLSPDGFALDRTGKWLLNTEVLPVSFPGNESDYLDYYNTIFDFFNGYYQNFNNTYDDIYNDVLRANNAESFINARELISRLDAFDFSQYMTSKYVGIRKVGVINETFKIEQVYYMTEIVKASERQDNNLYVNLCDKMSVSIGRYADDIKAILHQTSLWDIF